MASPFDLNVLPCWLSALPLNRHFPSARHCFFWRAFFFLKLAGLQAAADSFFS